MPRSSHGARVTQSVLAALLLVLAVLLAGCSTITTSEEEPAGPVGQIIPSKLAVIHTGAIRGGFAAEGDALGLAAVSGYARELEAEGYDVLLLDSGDTLRGADRVGPSDGESGVGFLNAAGYDALCLGAAELSLSARQLATRSSQLDATLLSADVTAAQDESLLAAPNAVFTLSDGRTVGVFALTSPSALKDVPRPRADELAIDADALTDIAQEQVAELRKAGCKLVFCLTSLGEGDETAAAALAGQVSGIDVILDAGGSSARKSTKADASGDDTLVVGTPAGLACMTVVFWEKGTLTAQVLDAQATQATDEQVAALVTQTALEQESWLAASVAQADKGLPAKEVASKECGLGDLVADAALWEGRHAGARVAPDAALIDAGSIRADLPQGAVTRDDAFAICPHDETRLYALQVEGSQLEKALEAALTSDKAAEGDFPQVAGLSLTLRETKGSSRLELKLNEVGGQPYSPDAHYLLVVTERIACGDGPYQALVQGAVDTRESLDTSAGKALASFLDRACHGSVPRDYEKAQGRIARAKRK